MLLTGMTEFAKEKFSKEKCLTAAVAECIMGEQPDALWWSGWPANSDKVCGYVRIIDRALVLGTIFKELVIC